MAGAAQKGLLLYLTDFDETTTEIFKQKVNALLSQCIQNKIFSASPDHLCTTRTDSMGHFAFNSINWDSLREMETKCIEASSQASDKKEILEAFSTSFALIDVQSGQDHYTSKKMLFISEFKNELKKPDLAKLGERITKDETEVVFVTPEPNTCDEVQRRNIAALKLLTAKNDYAVAFTIDKAQTQLSNIVAKKPVRPTPWNVTMEIGPELKLEVSGYLWTRKNKSSDTKQALLKTVQNLPVPTSTVSAGAIANKQGDNSSTSQADLRVIAEPTAKVVNKEEFWTQNDGTAVDPTNVVNGYYYGDRLVSFDKIQQSHSYSTGDKCFKVLLFCPKERIFPYYLVDDGVDLFFPKKGDAKADMIFSALLKVLHDSGKVAIVRKIRSKDAKLVIGVLSPDMAGKCLTYTNLCFADDVTIPKFPLLFSKEDLEKSIAEPSEKDNLMDQFIMSKSIDTFSPKEGPVDPSVQMFRENITKKILGKTSAALEVYDGSKKRLDNIQLFFDNLVKDNSLRLAQSDKEVNEVQKQLCLNFNISKVEKKETERVGGAQVFRKRNVENDDQIDEVEKKLKVEEPSHEVDKNQNEKMDSSYAAQFDVDNLQRDRIKAHRKVNHLYAFDFDHTMIEENSDVSITKLVDEPIPDEIENFYNNTRNWVAYMDKIMKFIGSKGNDIDAITYHIKNLEFTPGMEHLIQRVRKTREQDPSNHFIIISDSNDYFISTVLSKLLPPVEPNKIFTNRAALPSSGLGSEFNYMRLRPFEDQNDCQLCPRNLCKGKALTKYMMTQGPFSHTYYTGDGLNDLCPALYLGPSDTLFVRRGFGLEKVIREKHIGDCPVTLNCNIVYWNTVEEIENKMLFDTNKNIVWPKPSTYAD